MFWTEGRPRAAFSIGGHMEKYLPALVTGIIAILGFACTYGSLKGMLLQATKQNTEAIEKLWTTEGKQWDKINEHDRKIGEIKVLCDERHAHREGAHA